MTNKHANKPVYILGYSGLDNSLEFKKMEFPDLSTEEIRISQGMDSAAALIKNGKIIAASEEERFTYEKHTNRFPINAMHFCLEKAGISINEVDYVAHGFDYRYCKDFYWRDDFNRRRYNQVFSPDVQIKLLRKHFNYGNLDQVFIPVKHHEAHAASAYYPSGFDSALIVVVDGMGELYSTSIYQARGNNIKLLKQYNILSSLGMFYSMVTYHLGFSVNSDEYKVMGLAPYGNYEHYLSVMSSAIDFKDKGEIIIPLLLKNKNLIEKESYRGVINWLNENTFSSRKSDEEINQNHKDLAATLQYLLNKAMFHIVTYWQNETNEKNLCLGGGVALNCTANGEILKSCIFDDIYIQPAAGDDGTSIGAALYHYYSINPDAIRITEEMPFYGYQATQGELKIVLNKYKDRISYKKYHDEDLFDEIAKLIDQGKVVAVMQGEMEFGPRALGHRSIVADPRSPTMKDLINSMVKKREAYRPFAPSVTSEDAGKYFELRKSESLCYMIFTVPVKEKYKDSFPATTHIDGSARIQIVKKKNNRYYWNLLKAFEKKTEYPILLNTSFNVKGQPIVRTAEEAMKTFLNTGIHAVVIDNYLIFPKTYVHKE